VPAELGNVEYYPQNADKIIRLSTMSKNPELKIMVDTFFATTVVAPKPEIG